MSAPPPFKESSNCFACGSGFGVFKRRHHCRNCGESFCDGDSSKTIPLPHFNLTENCRTCEKCFNKIQAGEYGKQVSAAPEPVTKEAPKQEEEEEPIPAPVAPAKPAVPCTCGMPLCICAAPEEEKPQPKKEEPKVTQTPVKSEPAKTLNTPSSPSAVPASPSTFRSFQSTKTYSQDGEGLRDAVKSGDVNGVKTLLKADGSLASYKDRQGETILHIAAMFGHSDIAKVLVEHGADITAKNGQGESVLDLAPVALANQMKAWKM